MYMYSSVYHSAVNRLPVPRGHGTSRWECRCSLGRRETGSHAECYGVLPLPILPTASGGARNEPWRFIAHRDSNGDKCLGEVKGELAPTNLSRARCKRSRRDRKRDV